ncbi:hypothetical protein D9M72_571280 [compost metagenome]
MTSATRFSANACVAQNTNRTAKAMRRNGMVPLPQCANDRGEQRRPNSRASYRAWVVSMRFDGMAKAFAGATPSLVVLTGGSAGSFAIQWDWRAVISCGRQCIPLSSGNIESGKLLSTSRARASLCVRLKLLRYRASEWNHLKRKDALRSKY